MVSSAELVFLTSTPYLHVAHSLVVDARLFIMVPVVEASLTVTVTLLDEPEVGVVPSDPRPFAVTVSVTDKFDSP